MSQPGRNHAWAVGRNPLVDQRLPDLHQRRGFRAAGRHRDGCRRRRRAREGHRDLLGRAGSGRDFKGGEFVVRRDGQAFSVAPHPSAEFVKAMPGYFRDDLPVFLPRVRNRNVEPRREHEATYAEVEVWLKANLPTRRGLAERFQSRVKDAQFRGKLVENLAAHPEWEPVLFPEKYEKKKEDEEAAAAEKAEKAKRVQ